VPPALIRQILEAGTSAANGGNMQTWRFLVIRDPAIKADVAQWYRRGWHEIVAPRYRSGTPGTGIVSGAVRPNAGGGGASGGPSA